MSVTMSPDDLRALGYDPAASAKAGRAVRLADASKGKKEKRAKTWAPYASKWEHAYAGHLDYLLQLGIITGWAYEPDTIVCAGGTKYTPDFRVSFPQNRPDEYHEVKGFFRTQDRVRVREALAVSACDVILVSRAKGNWTYKRLPRTNMERAA